MLVACTTTGCRGRAERYMSCFDEDDTTAYPYCRECVDVLLRNLEEDRGPVDDPVVAERDRYREVLEKLLRETILAVLTTMPKDAPLEHLAVMIESQVKAWQAIEPASSRTDLTMEDR